MNLFDPTSATYPGSNWLGVFAGYIDSSEALAIIRIIGGVNLFYSPLWQIGSGVLTNGLCHVDANTQRDFVPVDNYWSYRVTSCTLVFEDPYTTGRWKREADIEEDSYTGPGHLHPSLWQVKGTVESRVF
ncbi:hypothetical protein N7495_000025 [Penicillium taxi]|uniref:uncharacterized protein n=1 Tax=Penicillium taxi TaxID=168475 RepID=UPI0025454F99|nr:uncharacterized protein N7495_000025 [Penicillium taxi]KAJ5907343.1 hypothetical protein N7495_000025 [Penicillium taxi]